MDREDREALRTVGAAAVLFLLGAIAVICAGLAFGLAWRTFTWAAGIGG